MEGRKQVHLENEHVTLTVLPGGGHIAALTLKSNNVNPLWTPPWPSIEPSSFDPAKHPGYGLGPEQRLLAGIAGHNLCFDFFGPPSDAETAAGLSVHGEASVVDWSVTTSGAAMHAIAELPQARMRITRELKLGARAYAVTVTETAENLMDVDRVVGWTQHATLGPPFVEPGKTVFHMFGHLAMSFFCGPYIMLQLGWSQEKDGTVSVSSALLAAFVAFGWAFITGLLVVGCYVAITG